MPEKDRTYIAIDLKSFFASVEVIERGLDPLTTNLVVADADRTEKTICLAVSPSLKAYGIPGRPRLFEVVRKVKEVNYKRKQDAHIRTFSGSSCNDSEVKNNPQLALDYITATPRMAQYIKYSTDIYTIYLRFVAPEDIHVYSIDEVFIDVTGYLSAYRLTARELAMKMIHEVLSQTGITATAGIGTNLYLSKIAMDIVAKKIPADKNGVRIAELDELTYRKLLWTHRPLTDFWRIGSGSARRLEENGMFTMGDIARCSTGGKNDGRNEEVLYKLFGINAELLIDHAWGWEPCTIADIKAYKPESNSIGSGQVLHCPYGFEKGKLIVREMTDLLALDLVGKGFVTDRIVLTVGYDTECLKNQTIRQKYEGPVATDRYGRQVPKSAHGTAHIRRRTSSAKLIIDAVMELYDSIVDKNLLIRRLFVTADNVTDEKNAVCKDTCRQRDLFTDYAAAAEQEQQEENNLAREKRVQQAAIAIKRKFGKNAIVRGMNLEEGSTTIERNGQIGGHKA